MNHSIATASRGTHLKIVVVALIAGIMVASVGIGTRLGASDIELAGVDLRPTVGVVKAAKPTVWTSHDQITIR